VAVHAGFTAKNGVVHQGTGSGVKLFDYKRVMTNFDEKIVSKIPF
jgi:hypothetical protein